MKKKARGIAMYLPQYHPIPENDAWWGKGFTEWYNVAKSKPLFKGHYQPKIPTELGFYDLRMPEIREQQAELARYAGIEGFMYWHYWFGGGRQLLERPFNEVLNSGKPNFPFCLGWANHTWTSKTWNKEKNKSIPSILMEQTYPGIEDYKLHFYSVLPAFKDPRYITVDGKPFFLIWNPLGFKNVSSFINCWQNLAKENGLNGIHFVGIASSGNFKNQDRKYIVGELSKAKDNFKAVLNMGFDAVCSNGMTKANVSVQGLSMTYLRHLLNHVYKGKITRLDQDKINRYLFCEEDRWENVYPTIVPNFDRTPRTNRDIVYVNSTPKVFKKSIENCLSYLEQKEEEHKIIILKSWNEWGEGNYVEPDIKYGRGYLDALRETIL